jgi:hypothetical protein
VLVLLNGQRMLPGDGPQFRALLADRAHRCGDRRRLGGLWFDAISGVVNFILRDKLEGVRFDVQGSINNHHNTNAICAACRIRAASPPRRWVADGGKVDVNGAYGRSFADGRGHVTVYGGYRRPRRSCNPRATIRPARSMPMAPALGLRRFVEQHLWHLRPAGRAQRQWVI